MTQVKMNEKFVEDSEKMMMDLIDSYESISKKLTKISIGIAENFQGDVGVHYSLHVQGINKKMNSEIGDFIKKNYNDIKILKDEFIKIDSAYEAAFNFETSDYKLHTSAHFGGTEHSIAKGSSFKRK